MESEYDSLLDGFLFVKELVVANGTAYCLNSGACV
jgi:hypothetical protein